MEACSIPATHQFPAIPAISRQKLTNSYIPKCHFPKSLACKASNTHLISQTNDIKSAKSSNKMFILGMGYVGQFFAQELKNEGWEVAGTCTSIVKKSELVGKGFDVNVFDARQPEWEVLDVLRSCTHLLISIPPAEVVGDPMLQHEEYLKTRFMDANLRWLCYLSSTSVYGDAEGEWIDEDYIASPATNQAKLRLDAEKGWLKLGQDLGIASYIFRLAGIYGPGRSAIDTILKNEPLSLSQKRRATRTFTSRVHVADICQALRASISVQPQRKIFNIVDDDPASRAEVFASAQQLIERRWPGLVNPPTLSVDTQKPKGGGKRVLNVHLKKELGVSLLYPSYKIGLQSIMSSLEDPIM